MVFDGNSNDTLFSLLAASATISTALPYATQTAAVLGIRDILGADGFTLVNSRVTMSVTWFAMTGRSRKTISPTTSFWAATTPNSSCGSVRMCGPKYPEFPAPITSEYAVKVYGQAMSWRITMSPISTTL